MHEDDEQDEPDATLRDLLRLPPILPLDIAGARRPKLQPGTGINAKLAEIMLVMPEIRVLLAHTDFHDLMELKNNGIKYIDEAAFIERIYTDLNVFKRVWK